MSAQNEFIILEIRNFNRFYTRVPGLIDQHLLASPYTLRESFLVKNG